MQREHSIKSILFTGEQEGADAVVISSPIGIRTLLHDEATWSVESVEGHAKM